MNNQKSLFNEAQLKVLEKAIKEYEQSESEKQIIEINKAVKYINSHILESDTDENGSVYFETPMGLFICYADYLIIWSDSLATNLTIDNRVYAYMKDLLIPLADKVRKLEKDELLTWQQD